MILFMYGIVYSVHFHSFKGLLAQGSDYSSVRAGLDKGISKFGPDRSSGKELSKNSDCDVVRHSSHAS